MASTVANNNQQAKAHNDRVQTIIVGGGVIGVATAHYLMAAGHAVRVIDQGSIGGGSSWGNCGYICPSHALPLAEPGMVWAGLKSLFTPGAAFRIKPQLRWGLYRWLWEFAKRCNHQQMLADGHHLNAILQDARDEYERLFAAANIKAQWQPKGLLYVLKSARGVEAFAETDQLLKEHYGVQAEFLDGAALSGLDAALKPGLAGGFWYRNDASLEPAEFVANWSRNLVAQGVELIDHCQLHAVQTNRGRVASIDTSHGSMQADHYVFAIGAWSQRLAAELKCAVPVEPCKGYSVTIPRPENSLEYPMLFPEHRVGVTPFAQTLRLGSMIEFAGYDQSIPKGRIEQLYQSARPYLNTALKPANEQPWSGWRPMTWDSLPIIGKVPTLDNAMLATGHNMLGMTLAPATGKLVAELITGQVPSIDPEPYSPSRF